MSETTRFSLLAAIAGTCVVVAFGVGVIASAAFGDDEGEPFGRSEGSNEVHVTLGDLFIEPATLAAKPGSITFQIHNEGGTDHNFVVSGLGASEMIAAGDSATLILDDVEPGTYEVICAVPGHADAGMKSTLTVGQRPAGSARAGAAQPSAMSGTPEEMAHHDAERTGAFPAETEGVGGVALEPRVTAGGTKVFELTAEEVGWETEPGKVVSAYAYNGIVPGPEIRVELGDRVRVVLHNQLPEPTTIHLHGLDVPNDMDGVPAINQDAVLPGQSYRYEFTVRNSGSHMYHSHFNAVGQVPRGLLGAFIVEDGLVDADVDFTMVLNDGPLGFTLNGKSFPATWPIVADKGQTVRIRYMNEGLQIHPMHLHGMSQTVIAKDGHALPQPYEADTILVAPRERYDVVVDADAKGVWAFHCHVLSHAEGPDGMFGMVTAMIVE